MCFVDKNRVYSINFFSKLNCTHTQTLFSYGETHKKTATLLDVCKNTKMKIIIREKRKMDTENDNLGVPLPNNTRWGSTKKGYDFLLDENKNNKRYMALECLRSCCRSAWLG